MLAVVPGAQRVLARQARRKTLVGSYHPGAGGGALVGASMLGTRVPPHLDGQCPTAGTVRRVALRPRSPRWDGVAHICGCCCGAETAGSRSYNPRLIFFVLRGTR